jgi:hypothetical protein
MMDYEEWLEQNEEELTIRWAESGRDREMCFDLERELEKEYDKQMMEE